MNNKKAPEFVYLIRNELTKNLKIGYTECPYKRRKTLQQGQDAQHKLLAYMDGDRTLEKQLHDKFSDIRIEVEGVLTEWFLESPAIYDYFKVPYDNNLFFNKKGIYCCDGIRLTLKQEQLEIIKSWVEKRDAEIDSLKTKLFETNCFLDDLIVEYENIEKINKQFQLEKEKAEKEKAEKEKRKQANHLIKFCEDMGIVQDRKSYVVIGELWNALQKWYQEKGYIKVVDGVVYKLSDENIVTSKPQMLKRFKEIFINLKSDKKNNQRIYYGIRFETITNVIPFQKHSSNNLKAL